MRMFGLCLVLFGSIGLLPAQEQGRSPSSLTVTGRGEVSVSPDEARVQLGVAHQASTASAAQQEVSRTAARIRDALLQAGIPADRIQTTELSLHPIYSQQRPGTASDQEPRIIGYRASNVVAAVVRDLDRIGPVVDAGLQAGANQLQGLNFRLRDDSEARQEALRRAAQEAAGKAEALASAFGVQLGGIDQVQEGGAIVRPVAEATYQRALMVDTATVVSPGLVTVEGTVTVRYLLLP